jgi:hypothetical protein
MVRELRDYHITDGELDRFVTEWRAGIAPLRRRLGFTIEGAWTIEDESRFVWILSHPGDWDAYAEADRAYYDAPERVALNPDPARLIAAQAKSRLDDVVVDP